ncbi:MAG: hypothetical protein RIR51_1862, partial [Bacteroidota bacterium]
MKKVFALLFVTGMMALASCGGEQAAEEAPATEEVAVESMEADTTMADTTMAEEA